MRPSLVTADNLLKYSHSGTGRWCASVRFPEAGTVGQRCFDRRQYRGYNHARLHAGLPRRCGSRLTPDQMLSMDRGHRLQRVFPPSRPLRWALPLTLLLGLLVLQWRVPGWADRAEAWATDGRFLLRGSREPQFPMVVLALDETSFQMMGDLQGENIRTWPRARWAELVRKIAAAGPRIIALDVVFDTPGWDERGDEALAEALASAGTVVLPSHFEIAEGGSLVTLSPPVPILAEAAAGVGVANFPTDADGAVRRTSLLFGWAGTSLPSYAVAINSLYAGGPVQFKQRDLAPGGTLFVNYRGPEGTFTTISMINLWLEEVDVEPLRDAVVLVGYTTQLEQDRHVAPFVGKRGMPGVELLANAVDTLLAGDWLRQPAEWVFLLLVGVAGLAALAVLNVRRPALGVGLLLCGVVVYLGLGMALFAWIDLLLPLVPPVVTAVVVGGTVLAERMIFAEREKRMLRRRFAGVMSPERLRAVLGDWEALLETERPKKQAAVLFADVRGFTSATESMMRQGRIEEMVRFLTAYLDAMAEAVFAEGGVIYDVVGDGLMILFGLPQPFADYALRAVRAAVRMSLATNGLQSVWPVRDQRPLAMGIGVHCGSVVDAVVGRGRRVEYSVIGDPVNTAARIEAHCKVAMEVPRPAGGIVPEAVTILISSELHDKVSEHVLVDDAVPPFAARGKAEPLQVVRLLGLSESEL
jgi:adenylate cyclase